MRDKQKTREGVLGFTGSKTGHGEKIRWEKCSSLLSTLQGKCARCPYSPGRGMACNLESCPFSCSGRCKDCAHLLPLDEHRRKARCRWTGERLVAGDVERVRNCIGFEERPGLDLCRSLRQGEVPLNQSRRSNRRFIVPNGEESIAAYSACLAAAMFIGRLAHIGGVATSSIREDWRLRLSRGALLPRLFFLIPKSIEVPHD